MKDTCLGIEISSSHIFWRFVLTNDNGRYLPKILIIQLNISDIHFFILEIDLKVTIDLINVR